MYGELREATAAPQTLRSSMMVNNLSRVELDGDPYNFQIQTTASREISHGEAGQAAVERELNGATEHRWKGERQRVDQVRTGTDRR